MEALLAAGVAVGFVALAGWAVAQWRRQRTTATGWLAAAFGTLAIGIVVSRLQTYTPVDIPGWPWVRGVLNGILAAFPWLLAAGVWALGDRTPRWRWLGLIGVPIITAWTFAVTIRHPQVTESEVLAVLGSFVLLWTIAAVATAVHLLRAGRRYPLARPRMRLMATGLLITNLALIADVLAGTTGTVALRSVMNALGLLAAATFLLAFFAPRPLRWWWRRAATSSFQRMQTRLVAALKREDVAAAVVPELAQVLGGGVTVVADDGTGLGHSDIDPSAARDLADRLVGGRPLAPNVQVASTGHGWLAVVTHPYTPVFGRDELALLDAYAAQMRIALERTQLFEDTIAQQRDLEEMLLGLAHDIRGPTSTIGGFLHLLADTESAEERAELITNAHASTAYLERLVDAMVELAQARHDGDVEPVDLVVVARRVAERTHAAHPPITITVTGEGPSVRMSPLQAEQLIENLVTNAVKHGERDDLTVAIEVLERSGGVEVVVADNGVGIAPSDRHRIFVPFQRGANVHAKGSGLGLGLVSRIVKQLGGRLTLEPSEQGARFVVRLPPTPITTATPAEANG